MAVVSVAICGSLVSEVVVICLVLELGVTMIRQVCLTASLKPVRATEGLYSTTVIADRLTLLPLLTPLFVPNGWKRAQVCTFWGARTRLATVLHVAKATIINLHTSRQRQ